MDLSQGYASFRARELGRLGWALELVGGENLVAYWRPGDVQVVIRPGTPYLRWGGEGVHLAHAPFREGGDLFLPVQFLVDVLPWKLPRAFRWVDSTGTLEVLPLPEGGGGAGAQGSTASPPRAGAPASGAARDSAPSRPLSAGSPVRVVVIDAGHGGRDPGAKGPGGTEEKRVVLGIAETLARILRAEPNLEVHLTRSQDELIPLWQRGEKATSWKGDRHGVFVSIHANALPNSRSTRGFETYFLSEARTEHERRVAALENAAVQFEERGSVAGGDADLSFILTELRNLDHQHWSALLAELVQRELGQVHPGPDRGVKQGPFAVITNALMPAVLLEVGFITNPEEERLLKQGSFQESAARAVADALREFFRRYPPVAGSRTGGGGGEP